CAAGFSVFCVFIFIFSVCLRLALSSIRVTHNARRLCEVFCISQNLQMYEVPERASDGKASGRCSGSPKGFRYIVLQLPEGGDFEVLHFQPSSNFDRSTKFVLSTVPPLLGRCCYAQIFSFILFISSINFSLLCVL